MKAIIFDHGLFVELALRLAREWNDDVGYFSPWASAFPNPNDQLIGSGLEDFGVRRIDFPWESIETADEPDIWIFPDLYFTAEQTLLHKLGKRVWGAGWGELVEMDRWKLHGLLDDAGWPTAETDYVHGVTALEHRLSHDPDKLYAKLAPYYRGASETYEHRGWPASRPWLDELKQKLGARGDSMPFMVQHPVPGDHVVEPGIDLIIRDGAVLYPTLIGYERKGQALISKVIDEIPELLAGPIDTVVQALSREGSLYSNFFSAELRVNEDGEAYFIDATTRMPRPGDGAHQELCSNLGSVIGGADGVPDFAGRYAVQIMLDSPVADKRPLHVAFPEEIRDNVKLYQFFRDEDGEHWTLPRGITNIASVVACGDDLADVKRQAVEYAKAVEADGLGFDESSLDSIERDIEMGRQSGVEF